jgi:hypothetical protein
MSQPTADGATRMHSPAPDPRKASTGRVALITAAIPGPTQGISR